jgi:hypothetical protein
MRFRSSWIGLWLTLALIGCGSSELTVSEYAAEIEQLVVEMEAGFASIDANWEAQVPSVAGAADYWEKRLEIRNDYLESIEALDPPTEVQEMHESALAVFNKITDADEVLAAKVASLDVITEHWQWVDTAEGKAADEVLAEVFAFCRASQEEFDATEDLEQFEDITWLPAEMKQVVRVAFGCPE